MVIFIIVVVVLIFLAIILSAPEQKQEENKKIILDNYIKKDYVMTQTELKFYRELKKVTDKLELTIFPQVNMERLISVKDNNKTDRNRIKSRTIDFCIVNNKNCKIVCCIELDDYTHNFKNRIERDNFVNDLFNTVGINLHRIKVNNSYNLEPLEEKIKESL